MVTTVYTDDACTGHDGPYADLWLETIGAKRLRIPPNCTAFGQPADRPQTNQKLKAFTSWEMHIRQVRAKLSNNFTTFPGSLTRSARELISKPLAAVRDRFNNHEKNQKGIKQAFEETLLGKPHSELAELLKLDTGLPASEERGDVPCPFGCPERWGSETKAYRNHHEVCFYTRKKLLEPLVRPPTSKTLNGNEHGLFCTCLLDNEQVSIYVGKTHTAMVAPRFKLLGSEPWWQKARRAFFHILFVSHSPVRDFQ